MVLQEKLCDSLGLSERLQWSHSTHGRINSLLNWFSFEASDGRVAKEELHHGV